MDKNQTIWNERTARAIVANLERRRFGASYVATADEARDAVLALIPAGAEVARCGSVTTAAIGLWEKVAARPDVTVLDHNKPGLSPEEATEIRRHELLADVMIASSNAITYDGRLVNLDGVGNRVAALAYGPRKVILVVGMNKVAPDLDTAIQRVKHYAAPVNALRVGAKTPCTETGLCSDCHSPQRLCNMWSVMDGLNAANAKRIHVVLVGETLGY